MPCALGAVDPRSVDPVGSKPTHGSMLSYPNWQRGHVENVVTWTFESSRQHQLSDDSVDTGDMQITRATAFYLVAALCFAVAFVMCFGAGDVVNKQPLDDVVGVGLLGSLLFTLGHATDHA